MTAEIVKAATVAVPWAHEGNAITKACATVAALPINGQQDLDFLTSGLVEIAARLKFIVEGRLARTRPREAELSAIRDETRAVEAAYAALKDATQARITRHRQETRAADDAARALALTTQEQAHAAARAGDLPTAGALQSRAFDAMTAAPGPVATEGTHTRREWRVRVTNKNLIRPEFLIVDEAKLLEHARKVLPKAAPDVDTAPFQVAGVEVYLHEHEVVNPTKRA